MGSPRPARAARGAVGDDVVPSGMARPAPVGPLAHISGTAGPEAIPRTISSPNLYMTSPSQPRARRAGLLWRARAARGRSAGLSAGWVDRAGGGGPARPIQPGEGPPWPRRSPAEEGGRLRLPRPGDFRY